jgi:hypothetical protein
MIPSTRRKFDAESKFLQGFISQLLHQNGHINSYSGSNLRLNFGNDEKVFC